MSNGDGQPGAVIFTWGPIPTSNICFPAGTPIKTDQGIVPIECLHTNHTINGEPIQHITKTKTIDPYLISFEPNTFAPNVPCQTTIMTKDHKILFQGQLVPAYRFLEFSDKVKRVKYEGDILFNVLLANYSTVSVNNIICETLHPENIIAKLHNSNLSPDYKNNMVTIMNDSLHKRDGETYKAIVNHIS